MYRCQDLKKEPNHRLMEMLLHVDNLYAKAQMLQILLSREGLYYKPNDHTIEELLSELAQKAAQQQVWLVLYIVERFFRFNQLINLFITC